MNTIEIYFKHVSSPFAFYMANQQIQRKNKNEKSIKRVNACRDHILGKEICKNKAIKIFTVTFFIFFFLFLFLLLFLSTKQTNSLSLFTSFVYNTLCPEKNERKRKFKQYLIALNYTSKS